ncbi:MULTISPECIES: hypothetical protein [Bradyrhizobium]|uniref:hypothetical protein n=1 Tax=Bradyrhizobium TaxID=374 RepID=UPI000A193C84|nr:MULTISPECIES: hypothetical protein [Bradyrhizobium]OSI23835.1 hypothetical protein BST65_20510 [Bradyrhizobium canariense]OSI31041.1 hypothetical protein BST66_21335 [Bradyrhizobium canariense]OSI39985.1 hypothetical protein BSZ20_28885 [Bradyrhizobium canariense]OSI48276.1 hypothetical protein BST67_19365 [Bradyrhizobium canariense]OSI50161.1 hypothetical protein BSZ15_34220 [Bradyrhizobium canariense]
MKDPKRRTGFAGAGELVLHAKAAMRHLDEVCNASAQGDKAAARKALRRAISELDVARAMFRAGAE